MYTKHPIQILVLVPVLGVGLMLLANGIQEAQAGNARPLGVLVRANASYRSRTLSR